MAGFAILRTTEPDFYLGSATGIPRNESTVLASLKALEVGKATGPDEIPAKLLKEIASVIAPTLCKIFNKSL